MLIYSHVAVHDISYLVGYLAGVLFGTMTEDDGHLDSDVLADWAQPVFLAIFCLAATAALVSVQEKALPRPILLAVTTPFALIGRWFSTLGAGQRAGDGQDMLLDNAATPSGSLPVS